MKKQPRIVRSIVRRLDGGPERTVPDPDTVFRTFGESLERRVQRRGAPPPGRPGGREERR